MNRPEVPQAALERIPAYIDALRKMSALGLSKASSTDLAGVTGFNAAQVRKDLSATGGGLGVRGAGYVVEELLARLQQLIGVSDDRLVVVVGHSGLTEPIVKMLYDSEDGFTFVALYDDDPRIIGTEVKGLLVQDVTTLSETLPEAGAELALIAVPSGDAQVLTHQIVDAGVRGVVNLTSEQVDTPDDVHVRQTCLRSELSILSFQVACDDHEDL